MADISEKIRNFSELFTQWSQWEDRYKQLIKIGKNCPPLADEYKNEQYRVKGCQSQVWLVAKLEGDCVYFQSDSDAMIVKGLASLLVNIFSGESPKVIVETPTDFLNELGILEHLSMNRSSGLASIIKQMKLYALAYLKLQKSQQDSGESNVE